MIISAGYNIAGPEVEQALLDLRRRPRVRRGRRSRTSSAGSASPPTSCCARASTDDDGTARRIQDHVKATLAPYKYPRTVLFVDALPKTATGKLQRFRLRDAAPVGAAPETEVAPT